jgi:hypothetical protein
LSDKQDHRDIYRRLGERIQSKEVLGQLELRTIFNQLIRLPEVYKIDFIEVHLQDLLQKSDDTRDEALLAHYRHYVSVTALSNLLHQLRESGLDFTQPIMELLEHIRNLQLMPGPSSKEREALQQLQFDLIYLLQRMHSQEEKTLVDLSSNDLREKLAVHYYDRILASFVSDSEDNLVSESEFIEMLKTELLKSSTVTSFAAKYSKAEGGGHDKAFLVDLGKVLSSTIQQAYLKNYEGIFNGNRQEVLKLFIETINNRCLDAEDSKLVDLEAVTSGILAIVLELVFNDGFGAFRKTITQSVLSSLEKPSHG